jgi:hypothetical protein
MFYAEGETDLCAEVAQSVEQRTENPCVAGSIPALGKLFQPTDLMVNRSPVSRNRSTRPAHATPQLHNYHRIAAPAKGDPLGVTEHFARHAAQGTADDTKPGQPMKRLCPQQTVMHSVRQFGICVLASPLQQRT